MVTINELFEKLNSFETSDEVATFLTERGIKGDVQDAESCVITNLFLTETNALGCTTTQERISVEDENFHEWEIVPTVPVVEFIIKFDDWQYLDLVWERDYEPEDGWNNE